MHYSGFGGWIMEWLYTASGTQSAGAVVIWQPVSSSKRLTEAGAWRVCARQRKVTGLANGLTENHQFTCPE